MLLPGNIHLAYCTNVHRGETWAETMAALEKYTLPVRRRVAPGKPYAIGLRLGARAAGELAAPAELLKFQRWLELHDCYVFTINGFPYGSFHGTRVKEQVYAPDWSTPERLAYTNLLFDLVAEIAPPGVAGSVSTSPGSFKGWFSTAVGNPRTEDGRLTAEREAEAANLGSQNPKAKELPTSNFQLPTSNSQLPTSNFEFTNPPDRERMNLIFKNLTACACHIEKLAERTGRDLHLGIEPEPRCLIETTAETVGFFEEWKTSDRTVEALLPRVGVNYDCCHLAIEFESPGPALDRLVAAGLRLSKLHLSSALRVRPDAAGREALKAFVEPTYLHQVVVGSGGTVRRRYTDLPDALADPQPGLPDDEWRVHFHVPLHAAPGAPFLDTRDHLLGALAWLAAHPGACEHLEMETYTWEVLPPAMRIGIEEQLVREYEWTLAALARRG